MKTNIKVALVTGANKGLGLEMSRQLAQKGIKVYLAGRDLKKVETAVNELQKEKLNVASVLLDVTNNDHILKAVHLIQENEGKLDILINNAGIFVDPRSGADNNSEIIPLNLVRKTFDTNFFAVIEMTQSFLPLLKKSPAARIVNMGSILGSLAMHSKVGSPIYDAKLLAYDASKTALNAVTVHFAHALKDTKIKVNTAHPGWVKTDMGTDEAPMNVKEGAKTGVDLALLDEHSPTGGFFHMGETLPW